MTMKGKKRFWAKVLAFMLIASMMVSNMATSSYAAAVDGTTTVETNADETAVPEVEEPKVDEQTTDEQKQEITEKDESEEDAEKLKTSTDETKKDDMASTEKTEEEKKTETSEDVNADEHKKDDTSKTDPTVKDENSTETDAVPEEVQAFLDAAAALPSVDQITVVNAAEIGEQVNAVLDMYEGLIDLGLDEREDVTAVMDTVYAVYEAVLAVEEIDEGAVLASGYTPVESVGIYPDEKPAGNTAVGKVRESNQSLTMKVGQKASFLLGAPTNTLIGRGCGHTIAVYNPSDYCDISLIDNSGKSLVGNPTYAAGNNQGTRVFDTVFEALKPGKSNDVRVCYYANFGIVFTNPNLNSAYVSCPVCGWNTLVYKDVTWYRYNDVFAITVNADYQLSYDTKGGSSIASTKITVANTTANLQVTSSKPTRSGYSFLGWTDDPNGTTPKSQYAAGEIVTLNWSEGYGSTSNPVTKTLYAIWQEEGAPEAPERTDLSGILGEFVKVHDVAEIHDDRTYCTWGGEVDGHYESSIGNVYTEDGAYFCNVTLNGDVYAAMYSLEPDFGVGEKHTLANDENITKTVTLKYDTDEKKWKSASGESKNAVLVTFNVTCSKGPDKELTNFTKEWLKTAPAVQLDLSKVPDGVEISYPDNDGKVKIPSNTNEKVYLLYKITVTGSDGASYKVTDTGAVKVAGDGMQTGDTISGVIEGEEAVIYVVKSFTANDIKDGKVKNEASLESGDKDTTKEPDEGDKETSDVTPVVKTHTVTVNFLTDNNEILRDPIKDEYDDRTEYQYPLDTNGINVASIFSMRGTVSIPWTVTGTDGKTYSLDTILTPQTELDKLESDSITENVEVNLIYSLDAKGGNDSQESEGGSDGTPDKYQAKIIYASGTNGTIQGIQSEYLTINDEGTMSTTGMVTISGATAVANAGYSCSGWNAQAEGHEGWTHEVDLNSSVIVQTSVPAKGNAIYTFTAQYDKKPNRDVTVVYVDEELKVLGKVEDSKQYGETYDVSRLTDGITYQDEEGNNYIIVGIVGDPVSGTIGDQDIFVRVICTLDNIGPDGRPDNVPDKYQATVTFQAVNGTVTGAGTDGTYKTVLTLTNPDIKDEKNPDGWATAAAGGKAALLAVPTTNPNAGYGNGTWNAVPRVGMEITEDRTFVITYTATTPTNPPTTPTTPPTGGGGTGGGGTPDPTPTPTPTAVLPIAPTVIPAATPTPTAPAETPEAEPVEAIEDAETPLANDETPTEPEAVKIEEEEVPLASGRSWALLNLILAILTVVVSVVLLVGYFFGKKKDQEEDDEIQTYQDEEELKRKGLARILSILPAVVSVIFFILTENMRNPMIFVDKWTLWMVVFAIANVALAILSKKTRKDDDDNKQKPGYEMA